MGGRADGWVDMYKWVMGRWMGDGWMGDGQMAEVDKWGWLDGWIDG